MRALKSFAACVVGLALACSVAAAKDCAPKIAGITGTVEVQLKGKKDWKAASIDQCLKVGDKVRTQKDSQAAISYGDEDQVRVNALSVYGIDSLDPDAGDTDLGLLDKGEAWAKVSKPAGKFSIKTPTAVAAVRGTEFDVEVGEDGESTVRVLDGTVGILNDLGEVLAEAGQMAEVLKDMIPGEPMDFDIDEFRGKLDEWKDKVQIGKIIEAKKEEIENKVDDVKKKIKVPKF